MALSKNEIKYLRSLAQKKYRQKYNKFVVEGDKLAREILADQRYQVDAVYALAEWTEQNRQQLWEFPAPVYSITPKELARISNLKTPNQVFVVANQQTFTLKPQVLKKRVCLYLDAIRDPGNLGTILRIADWFGIPYVFRSADSVELYSPKVIQASMGAFLRVESPELSLEELVKAFPGTSVYGAAMSGRSIYEISPLSQGIIVIGNEGSGISQDNLTYIEQLITIPKGRGGGAESLNAAVATGIICALVARSW